jgi:signal transduction histidine kinase
MLGRIDVAADRLETLIDELLTVTGFEAGVVTPNLAEVSVLDLLARVASDVVNELRHGAPDASALQVDCDPALLLMTDERLLRHAVRLLVDNALKYGTTATLRASRVEDGSTVIEIVDDGPGVPDELRERIFERFTRGPDENSPGMGLGLPLVRALAGGLGARVTVDDGPDGKGAAFRLVFASPAAR